MHHIILYCNHIGHDGKINDAINEPFFDISSLPKLYVVIEQRIEKRPLGNLAENSEKPNKFIKNLLTNNSLMFYGVVVQMV